MRFPLRALYAGTSLLLATSLAAAATKTVGVGKEFPAPCAAIAAAADGDVIDIDAGEYPGDMCQVPKNGLTLRGVGGRAVLDGQGGGFGGKGIWVISGNDVTVENVEFKNSVVPSKNGAGIRSEGIGLTVRNSFFHDNENGILTANLADAVLVMEHCEFARNGHGDGQSHNIYVGHSKRFELRYSYSHDAKIGHLVKSRADENVIESNRLTGEAGTSSYELDLPSGGRSFVIGNVIEQGETTDNSGMFSYGSESDGRNPVHDLYVVNNTFVNHRQNGGTFVYIDPAMNDGVAKLVNNVFAGNGTVSNRVDVENAGSCVDAPGFVDEAGYDFHLGADSPCKDLGVAAGVAGAVSLVPTTQYVHPLSFEGRVSVGAIDSGAFEVGGGVAPGTSSSSSGATGSSGAATSSSGAPGTSSGAAASSGTAGDGGAEGSAADAEDDGGCGCHTTSGGGASALAFGWLTLLLVRRTRRSRA